MTRIGADPSPPPLAPAHEFLWPLCGRSISIGADRGDRRRDQGHHVETTFTGNTGWTVFLVRPGILG